jgi:hypothetical protein
VPRGSVDGRVILAFAERIVPRASDLWVQASLDYKQRLQQLFFPEGMAFDGSGFIRTAVTVPAISYLRRTESRNESVVSRLGIEPRTRRLRERLVAVRQCPPSTFPLVYHPARFQCVRRFPVTATD